MADQKTSDDPVLATPGANTYLAGVDIVQGPLVNYRVAVSWLLDRANHVGNILSTAMSDFGTAVGNLISAAQVSAVPQFERNSTGALALTRAQHQGSEVTLSATGATFSFSASTEGNGFTFILRNRTGAALTIPTINGATREYALGAAHTQLKSGGNAVVTVYTRNGTMYVEILGDTQ